MRALDECALQDGLRRVGPLDDYLPIIGHDRSHDTIKAAKLLVGAEYLASHTSNRPHMAETPLPIEVVARCACSDSEHINY